MGCSSRSAGVHQPDVPGAQRVVPGLRLSSTLGHHIFEGRLDYSRPPGSGRLQCSRSRAFPGAIRPAAGGTHDALHHPRRQPRRPISCRSRAGNCVRDRSTCPLDVPATRPVPHPLRAPPRLIGPGALDHGAAYCTNDFSGSALWMPPGAHLNDEAPGKVMAAGIDPTRQGEVFALLEGRRVASRARPLVPGLNRRRPLGAGAGHWQRATGSLYLRRPATAYTRQPALRAAIRGA